jgi:hypothetical protein
MRTPAYPVDFVEACKAEFPLANEFHSWLDSHDARVGKFLEHARNVTPFTVRVELHRRWCSIANHEDSDVTTNRFQRHADH